MAELLRQRDVATRALRIFRSLDPRQQAAWLRMGQRMVAGMSTREAGYRMYRELGMPAHEARDRIDAVLARPVSARGEVA